MPFDVPERNVFPPYPALEIDGLHRLIPDDVHPLEVEVSLEVPNVVEDEGRRGHPGGEIRGRRDRMDSAETPALSRSQ